MITQAVSMLRISTAFSRAFSTSSSILSRTSSKSPSSSSSGYRDERIVVTEDKTVIACWHPPPQFPYEMSRPIPRQENTGSSSPLKVQVTDDMKELFHHKHDRFLRRDLMRITWTTKHRWFPNRSRQVRLRDQAKNPREKPYM